MYLPSLPTRYLLKFQLGALPSSRAANCLKSGAAASPVTAILENSGKVTLYVPVQNCWISLLLPGSCPPKSLAGKPRITSPLSL
jgi:hypothetical protein